MQTVFFDIDTQFDFMDPKGKLYAAGAEEIVPNLRDIFALAERQRFTTISTMDAHTPDDPEFKQFNSHCVAGSAGQARVLTDRPNLPRRVIPPTAKGGVIFEHGLHYIVEKTQLDPFSNPWLDQLLKGGKLNDAQAVVFGVATELCVNNAVQRLLSARIKTSIVIDAIRAIDPSAGQRMLDDWKGKGGILVTTKDLLGQFRWLGHMPAPNQTIDMGPRPKYPGKAPRH